VFHPFPTQPMQVLLNTTASELDRLGGDFTHYRDWLRLSSSSLQFVPVSSHRARQAAVLLRKALEKSCRTWQPASMRRALLLLSRFLYVPRGAASTADLILSHLLFPWPPWGSVPIVWSSQGISPAIYYERYNQGQWTVEDVAFVYRVLGRRAAALMIFTQSCARNIVAWCPELEEKIWVVPPPVFAHTRASMPKPSVRDGIIRLLFVGTDAVRKGLPTVVEAFAAIKAMHPTVELDIVSRPSPELQARIGALSGARLHLSSFGIDVKAMMARADVFVLPTRADTYALAAVEAMAHGCAVIISDLEPLPEVIPDGEVGFVLPADDVGALAAKMDVLATELDLLRTLQDKARKKYSTCHSPDAVTRRLVPMFEQIAGGRWNQKPAYPESVKSAQSAD
jgi:glycosyltransferase involved in cell wall biosynthesis